ncbi:pro-sigmaK processing inhibitor BofA family protein [uncultured Methanosphaera sp.]|uniref:pro-sigmaK processing inhibitor BofA family protein n=1 Tax=uncultured Methanosphaera sp. TaxID=262501 RepID=UPI002598B16E|nr:pro-sigmaK processing inhibitor BofA family protein [uncultured Methanosphaera sp.]
MLIELITLLILIPIAIIGLKLLIENGDTILKIITHLAMGWITLVIVNIIPGIHIPINLITILISGFGGILGTILLVLLSIIF